MIVWLSEEFVRRAMPEDGKVRRPWLVIQQDSQNETSSSTVVVYLTSKGNSNALLPYTVFVPKALSGLPEDSFVDCGKIITCKWPRDVIACLMKGTNPRLVHQEVLAEVNKGLRKILDLDPTYEIDDTRSDLRKSPSAKTKAIQGKRTLNGFRLSAR